MGRGSLAEGGHRGRVCGMVGSLAAIAVAIIVATGVPTAALAGESAAVGAAPLNLRAEPGTWAAVVGLLWQGESIALLDGPTSDGWYLVQAGDQTGWVYGGGLDLGGSADTLGQGGPGAANDAERWIDVDRTTQMVTLFDGNAAVASFWAAMGSDPSDDGFFATAVGTYYVYDKYGGLSWTDWGDAWIGDWVGFDPTRLNGFHTYSMNQDGQVIPGGDGPTGGCVALAPSAADQLFAFVSVGTRVEVHR